MRYLSKILSFAVCVLLVSGCNMIMHDQNPETMGMLYQFKKKLVKGGDFWITTYQKIEDPAKPFVFYIEGDGVAFVNRYKVSHNPTPRQHMLIKLAAMDQRPNVVYVARPCQFTPMNLNPKCTNSYWTTKRLSDDSVDAINEVIMSINKKKEFNLVGFSGGGGIAVLIAARNKLARDIITISGNLDHKAFTTHHNVTPMLGSMNPIDYAKKINKIPQLHLSGGKDKTVPPFIADGYRQESKSNCVKHMIFEDNTHLYGWEQKWKYILTLPVTCYD
jgi:hypothetical protein